MPVTHSYMIEQLLRWNPTWNIKTVARWSPKQLYAIYCREQQRNLGLVVAELATPKPQQMSLWESL